MDRPRFDPLSELGVVRDILRELNDQGLIDPRTIPPAALASLLAPLDILDVGASLVIQVNMPGAEAKDVTISVQDDVLTVSADLKADPDIEGAVYLRRERRFTKPTRSVTLPVKVEAERADATLRNGILTVTLPKIPAVVPKSIKVTTVQ
jgi:HSP20 family protein